jgi:aminoglycoside phosphotransferase (APT) family kinase protein
VTAEFRDRTTAQDWAALRDYLATLDQHLDDVPPRQFAGGAANLNYLISIDGGQTVLRRPPPGQLAEGASDMAREWRVLSTLPPHYPLAPQGRHFCDDPEVLGAPFQLIEYRDGQTIGGHLPPSLAGRTDAGPALSQALVDALASLHRLDPDEVGLGTLGRPAGFLGRQVEGWTRRADAAYDQAPPVEVAAITARLRATIPETGNVSLIHGDLKLDNMIVDPHTLAPVAVVDWDMATRGDPLFDLGVLASYWIDEDDPVELRAIGQVPSLEPGFPSRAELIAAYFAAAATPPQDLAFVVTLARLRLAIAWQQLNQLYRRGALTDPRYDEFAYVAQTILTWTADTLDAPPQ